MCTCFLYFSGIGGIVCLFGFVVLVWFGFFFFPEFHLQLCSARIVFFHADFSLDTWGWLAPVPLRFASWRMSSLPEFLCSSGLSPKGVHQPCSETGQSAFWKSGKAALLSPLLISLRTEKSIISWSLCPGWLLTIASSTSPSLFTNYSPVCCLPHLAHFLTCCVRKLSSRHSRNQDSLLYCIFSRHQ